MSSMQGIEAARRRLPELVAAAHRGETTVITKHGRPYAALVPLEQAEDARRNPAALLALKGCARGLWGEEPAHTVDALRREWGE
ncbi:type II toxin-antitoxin system Phd/YefM family antitoxin [Zeimonas arvi]|nr:type II toxin-antitoxin system Phd/YefM family antitoxin [Zeimonas arvi]